MLNFNAVTNEESHTSHDLLCIKPKRLTPAVIKYLKRHKVYISMTSGPLRLKKLPSVLNLLDLTNIAEIHINLPKFYYG